MSKPPCKSDLERIPRIAYAPTRLALALAGQMRTVPGIELARETERACFARSGVLDALAAREHTLKQRNRTDLPY